MAPERSGVSSRSSDKTPRRRGRTRTACVKCRRAKIACDSTKFPCARCKRLGHQCVWDDSFGKPTEQAEADDRESTPLRQARAGTSHGVSAGSEPGGFRVLSPNVSAIRTLGQDVKVFKMRDFSLLESEARRLFTTFFKRYHDFVPFLNPSRSPSDYHQISDFLFWAIIAVGVRDEQHGDEYLSHLSPFFTSFIAGILSGGRGNAVQLEHIQALVLLTLWPCNNVHWWTDRSWTMCNVAVNLARQIGLHLLYYETEYSKVLDRLSDESRLERLCTWCACVAVSQNLTSDFGHANSRLPLGNLLFTKLCNGTSSFKVPKPLQDYLTIQRSSAFALSTLPTMDMVESVAAFSDDLMTVLPQAEQSLDLSLGPGVTLFNELNLAAAQMCLLCNWFQVDPSQPVRRAGVLRAYAAAMRVVDLAMSENEHNQVLRYAPRTLARMLMCASAVICRVLHSSLRQDISYEAGKILFNAALLCIRQQAIRSREDDTPVRFAKVLRRIWTFCDSDSALHDIQPTFQIRTRSGASVIYDCLALVRKSVGNAYLTQGLDEATETSTSMADPIIEIETNLAGHAFDFDLLDFSWSDDPEILGLAPYS